MLSAHARSRGLMAVSDPVPNEVDSSSGIVRSNTNESRGCFHSRRRVPVPALDPTTAGARGPTALIGLTSLRQRDGTAEWMHGRTSQRNPSSSPASAWWQRVGGWDVCECKRAMDFVLTGSPDTVLCILRSAHTSIPHPRLESVIAAFRSHWLRLGVRRYPQLTDDIEDAVQMALVKLVSRDKLATLHNAERLGAWSRSLFIHTVLDLLRDVRRHSRSRAYLGEATDDSEVALRTSCSADPTPEDIALQRERIAIVVRLTAKLPVAHAKFVEDLPEKEIARRQRLSRYSVASQLKRTRRVLRRALENPESAAGTSKFVR